MLGLNGAGMECATGGLVVVVVRKYVYAGGMEG